MQNGCVAERSVSLCTLEFTDAALPSAPPLVLGCGCHCVLEQCFSKRVLLTQCLPCCGMTRGHPTGNGRTGVWAEGSLPPTGQLCFKDLLHTLGEILLEENEPLLGYRPRLQG